MEHARLLLVDDNRDNVEILGFLLGKKYRVSGHTSAKEALNALDSIRPNVVILDIGMKPIDGIQCLHAIRALPGYATIPAIALTGFARVVEQEAFLAAGFQAVVTKPILAQDKLQSVIERLVISHGSAASY